MFKTYLWLGMAIKATLLHAEGSWNMNDARLWTIFLFTFGVLLMMEYKGHGERVLERLGKGVRG